jgi:hypothetical protein
MKIILTILILSTLLLVGCGSTCFEQEYDSINLNNCDTISYRNKEDICRIGALMPSCNATICCHIWNNCKCYYRLQNETKTIN